MASRKRIDTSSYTTFSQITERLDEIVAQVKRKDVPLESSLDLFDEAIALGSKAVDFVDTSKVLPNEAPEPGDGDSAKGDDQEGVQATQDKHGAQESES